MHLLKSFRRLYLAIITTLSLSFLSSCDTLQQAASVYGAQNGALGTPTNVEISSGLKQALEFGVKNGVDLLSQKDAFLKNAAVKILFPPEAQKIEKTLRDLGLNQLCDNVITSLNHAAEDAMKEATPIFVNAIKQMTIADATNILLGEKNAATLYFKDKTTLELTDKFKPVIANSLQQVGATRYWGDLATKYNSLPLVKSVETDLSAYVTQKAIDGLFMEIAQEELKIRQNTFARSTSLLQKVFGYADRTK